MDSVNDVLRINEWTTVRVPGGGRISMGDGLNAISIEDSPTNRYLVELLCEGRTVEDISVRVTELEPSLDSSDVKEALEALVAAGVVQQGNAPTALADHRYDRQLLYWRALGASAEDAHLRLQRLQSATVLVLGCGGMGAMTALNLITCGVSNMHVVDSDEVEASNLNRSFLFTEADVGLKKSEVAAGKLRQFRKDVQVEATTTSVQSQSDIEMLLEQTRPDYMVMAADKPYLRINRWANGAALKHDVPYSAAGVAENYASVGPLVSPGRPGCFKCQGFDTYDISDAPPAIQAHNARRAAPSFGPLISATAAIHADQIVEYLSSVDGDPAIADTQVRLNFSTMQTETIDRSPKPECTLCR